MNKLGDIAKWFIDNIQQSSKNEISSIVENISPLTF